jgi:hypothetical protein
MPPITTTLNAGGSRRRHGWGILMIAAFYFGRVAKRPYLSAP